MEQVLEAPPQNAAPTAESPPRVLCVDDEPAILSALRRVLRPDRYEVRVATGGAQALQMLEEQPVDLVISDMRMPEMDGAAFLTHVAARWPETVRILLTGYSDFDSTVAAVNQGQIYRYLAKPWDEGDLRLTVRNGLERRALARERDELLALTAQQNEALRKLNTSLEDRVKARTEELRQTAAFLETAYESARRSYRDAIPVFAQLIKLREGHSAGHSRRVGEMARLLGAELHLDEQASDDLYFAGLLHDIGEIGLPDDIVATPYEKLSAEQQRQMQRHTVIGPAALMSLEPMENVARIMRAHHERFDGSGYPDGLAGESIPHEARILAVVNDYDQLLTGQLDGERRSPEVACRFLVEHRGTRYDPEVVRAFLGAFDRGAFTDIAVAERRITSAALKEGMVLSRDAVNASNVVMVAKGTRLNAALINKLRIHEKDQDEMFELHVRTSA
ncbi:MAG: response regulator [Ectothiorhodospiraceae bacterium]|nr:response regulator [Chromatiales bacterium]MCP5155446.1 response regulator [Ectothiorhodospiraceae bacterium]